MAQNRKSINLLPALFRTDKNSKFLSGTIDQLIQTPQIERINGWTGSTETKTYNPSSDYYLTDPGARKNYKLEPAVVIRDSDQKIKKVFGYDDLINQINFEGGITNRLDRLLEPEYYAYDPHIDWDKFVNYSQYYWLPVGPTNVAVAGLQKTAVSRYTLTETEDKKNFILTPDGLTPDPLLTLYKGITYEFSIEGYNSKEASRNVWIKTKRQTGASFALTDNIINNGTSTGVITLVVTEDTPTSLFYVAEDDRLVGGEIIVRSIQENSKIDIESEVLGKKTYTSGNGITFTNGLVVRFIGDVRPTSYRDKVYVVEGVGDKIVLVDMSTLETPEAYSGLYNENFDGALFDKYPFDNFNTLPLDPEYVTINRASIDRNPWSRYNRWFHKDVIIQSATYNGLQVELDQTKRAVRPIIEFKPNLQLYNFGNVAKPNIQHIDTITTDAFSNVEGQYGYYVDGYPLEEGDRVIFAADTDPVINGRTYVVHFSTINGEFLLNLVDADDVEPLENDAVLVTKGTEYQGTCWRYANVDGKLQWIQAQQKETLNQAPRFEIFDEEEHAYGDTNYYQSNFIGTKIFGYSLGSGGNDPVLGFPLKYRSVANQSYYLFDNYFTTDISSIVVNEETIQLPINKGFIRVNKNKDEYSYVNVWTEGKKYQSPIIQYQVIQEKTNNVEITAINNPGYQNVGIFVSVNDARQFINLDYTLYANKNRYFVTFNSSLSINDKVLIKLYTNVKPSDTGYYETSIGYTNNSLNGPISSFTLAELTDHVETMADTHPEFVGDFLGSNNIRDISDFNQYGTRLISNKTPVSFASFFIADKENSVIPVLRKASQQYEQFKLGFLKKMTELTGSYTPDEALDIILHNMNINKDINFPYSYSDMVAYGKDVNIRTWTVTDIRNVSYYLTSIFDPNSLSYRSVLVYHTDINTGNTTHLIQGVDYIFDSVDPVVTILRSLSKGDTIKVKDYPNTVGCYIPPTPSKLGVYPKFVPEIYIDNTYADESQTVIQGHDGSIMIAYGDFRDEIILEFEKRIYNNIKSNYNPDLFNIHDVLPGAFRTNEYSYAEISSILKIDFLKWAGFYGFDYELNDTVTEDPKTFNFKSANNPLTNRPLPGGWRGIFKFFYDTDRPHTHPWEMLGFPLKPLWWEEVYGPAPYTKDNLLLWQDLEAGLIRDPAGIAINSRYARPGLTTVIPVDEDGNLLDPASCGIAQNLNGLTIENSWMFGDIGPTEAAWRRSSVWPFSVQILMALTKPAKYCSELFDVSRMVKNFANQYIYDQQGFITPGNLKIHLDVVDDTIIQSSGYSVLLVEINRQRNRNYISNLKLDLANFSLNLMNKVGGFVNKNKLEIIIDATNPNSSNPGVSLPPEDYTIFLNQSNPIRSIGISGIIVERTTLGYVLRGYDKIYPFFNCLMPEAISTDPAFTVGGKTEPYVTWAPSETGIDVDTGPTAVSSSGYKYYQQGQVVFYNNGWYRVKTSHSSGKTFNDSNFIKIPSLPRIGGVTVQKATRFSSKVTNIPYGKEFYKIQDLYDTIIGYGKWLESQGLILDEYVNDLNEVIDWNFTAKEILFWTSQNWTPGSVITLSPFANSLKISSSDSVVNNIVDNFYEYTILKADGKSLDYHYISTSREDGIFNIKTTNTADGIYFARLNFVQKEHAIVLNNSSLFGDIIYDIESGYRQRRIKLVGFRTSNWNGDIFSPGFIYDEANITDWSEYQDYSAGDVVRYSGNYFSASTKINGSSTFDFTQWRILGNKPVAQLLPNFDYKIGQFEDFYSLDIDNFDSSQQMMAQHLIGYTSRSYLDNIFVDQISQYKFYQGYIKEKGTRNSIQKLSKISQSMMRGNIDYKEEWAFRIGSYGSYTTSRNIEINLDENKFKENPQIIKFVDKIPINPNEVLIYQTPETVIVKPEDYSSSPFPVIPVEDKDQIIKLPYAGYVRLDDVTYTVVNKPNLLKISNNRSISEGDTVWMCYRDDCDWDVYRYTNTDVRIIQASIKVIASSLLLTTNYNHLLSVGDIISISQLDKDIDGIYIVQEVPSLTQFVVSSSLVTVSVKLTPGVGLLFKFTSSRFNTFDNLLDYAYLNSLKDGEKIWVDNAGNGQWGVFEKVNAYSSSTSVISPTGDYPVRANESYGHKIVTSQDGLKWAVSSPTYFNLSTGYGKIFVYRKDSLTQSVTSVAELTLNDYLYVDTTSTGYGYSLSIDNDNDLIISGSPYTDKVKAPTTGDVRIVNSSSARLSYINQGVVKVDKINYKSALVENSYILSSREPQNNALFGYSIAQVPGSLIISSPGQDSNSGAVHIINYSVNDNGDVTFTKPSTDRLPTASLNLSTTSKFGYTVSASIGTMNSFTATFIAVGSPGYDGGSGAVFVYKDSALAQEITLSSEVLSSVSLRRGDGLGSKVLFDATGQYLFISTPYSTDGLNKKGKVLVLKRAETTSTFVLNQIITAPYGNVVSNFGIDLSIEVEGDTLTIAGVGALLKTTFDENNSSGKITTFDSGTTEFQTVRKQSGSIYLFNKYNDKFIFAQTIDASDVKESSLYGSSVVSTNNAIFVGAPGIEETTDQLGRVYIFNKDSNYNNTWNLLREEEPLVDLTKIQRNFTIDSDDEIVLDYLDIIDPIKGQISGIAEQELKYMSMSDPAIYSLGDSTTVNNTNENWIDEHVGELWWDLSTVKFTWYEQGDVEYRRNNWNSIFPGTSIDVYEWVRTPYLPSQWSSISDTNEGLVQGISGQPKHSDNSVLSVKQVFNPVSQSFTNVYYYWVKNKTTIPTDVYRRTSAFDVASAIADPKSYGLKYTSFISDDSLMLVNTKPGLREKSIHLAIEMDSINNDINKHTEWLLLQEDNDRSLPSDMLFSKIVDSLLGRDSLGNPVPDPNLPSRLRYGIEYRPRQSVFVDRFGALRIFVEYVNSILKDKLVSDNFSFENLNAIEEIPNIKFGTYDVLVEDLIERDIISTRYFKPAKLSCEVKNGRISKVQIIETGLGYKQAPTVSIIGDGINAKITTTIDSIGSVVSAKIYSAGEKYTIAPTLIVRPFTAIVQSDSTVNGRWSKYEWDTDNKTWGVPLHIQSYNTTNYWKYIDWVASNFNIAQEISLTIDEPYQLDVLTNVIDYAYVKINNAGNGKSIILQRIPDSLSPGTYSYGYNLVYQQDGTIQLLDSLWNYYSGSLGFDAVAAFDQTLFDQTPDKETEFIIKAVMNDIFVRELQPYLNKLFFKFVRYALTEQKFLDWALKTSFITVINNSGSLDQRPTYKLNNTSYYESFIEENKPYHTKIRNFTDNYTATDVSLVGVCDFDLPSYYDINYKQFLPVTFGTTKLSVEPYKSWFNNYTYFVESIDLFDGGDGYQFTPDVIIEPTNGDVITDPATAVAYISLGKVTNIVVTHPGSGYTSSPAVRLKGGGPTSIIAARAGAKLANNKVRSNLVQIKFDRVSGYNEIGNSTTYDEFLADGFNRQYQLTWFPDLDKSKITITSAGILVLSADYTIEVSTVKFRGHTKKIATVVLDSVPSYKSIVRIEYTKNVDLYHAVDRIRDFYKPTSGMPGNTATLLMSGLEYPGITIDSIPFRQSEGWDSTPWNDNVWDDFDPEQGFYEADGPVVKSKPQFFEDSYFRFRIFDNSKIISVKAGALATVTSDATVYTVTSSTRHIGDIGTYTIGYWDIYLDAPIPTFSSTSSITFTNPNPTIYKLPYFPAVGSTVTVYVNSGVISESIRIDDPNYINYKGNWSETTNYSTSSIVLFQNTYYQTNDYISATPVRPISTSSWKEVYYTPNITMQSFIGAPGVNTIDIGTIVGPNKTVVFRPYDSDGSILSTDIDLDTRIYGGDFIEDVSKYHDIDYDGDGLITSQNSYGPEENVPGKILESLGITVYSRPASLTPTIINKKYILDGTTSTFNLGLLPASTQSLQILLGGQRITSDNFSVDYLSNQVTFDETVLVDKVNQVLSLTTIGVSAGILTSNENTATITLIDSATETITTSSMNTIVFNALYLDAKSSYVTVNGIRNTNNFLTKVSGRTAIQFSSTLKVNDVVQAWIFSTVYKSFSEISEQVISDTLGVYDYDLAYPPGNIEPYHGRVIVEKDGKRLLPPDILYFMVEDLDSTYPLNYHINYPDYRVSTKDLNVYVNGVLVTSPKKYKLSQADGTIKFTKKSVKLGDAIAIVILIKHDYEIRGTKLHLTDQVDMSTQESVLRVITFNNHDSTKMRKERFSGKSNRRYSLSRKILNTNYIWVEVNGECLIQDIDYRIVKNQIVELFGEYELGVDDNVVITTIEDTVPQVVTAYRMFTDILGRTTYKRISESNSTQLAEDLLSTATSITVIDGSVLVPPNPLRKLPGTILVGGERIEFFEQEGNVLTKIKRGTFGSGVKARYSAGTTVIDQSYQQTIPAGEQMQTKRIKVTGTVTEDGTVVTPTQYYLNTITFDPSTDGWSTNTNLQNVLDSQIEVYYQGRRLMRSTDSRTVHQSNISYDSEEINSLGVSSDVTLLREYYVNTSSQLLNLEFMPDPGSEIKVIRRTATLWDENSEFLKEHPASLPDKYYYGK